MVSLVRVGCCCLSTRKAWVALVVPAVEAGMRVALVMAAGVVPVMRRRRMAVPVVAVAMRVVLVAAAPVGRWAAAGLEVVLDKLVPKAPKWLALQVMAGLVAMDLLKRSPVVVWAVTVARAVMAGRSATAASAVMVVPR